MLNKWCQTFLETGSCEATRCIRAPTVDRIAVINHYVENLRQSLRRETVCLEIFIFAVRSTLKYVGIKCYHCKIIHQLKSKDTTKRHELAQIIIDKSKEPLNFGKLVLFSDAAVFHLEKTNHQTIFFQLRLKFIKISRLEIDISNFSK